MKKSNLRVTAAWQALALLGAGAPAAFIAATPAAAQDYTSGAIAGTVTDEAGRPVTGATVTVTSTEQGGVQTTTTSAGGTFRFSGLPQGNYNVAVTAAGHPAYREDAVTILPGQTADLAIQLAATGSDIVVTGTRAPQFSGTTTGVNVDVAKLIKTVPISRNLTSVVLLAPSTSRGDSAFGNLASIGGGSVAENAYYVNGLNTTNFDNYVGSATVPFDFYRSVEVKEGGYPAEFGRATGGIVNAVTKSGSNDFMAAMHLTWNPNFLNSKGRDLLNCDADTGICAPRTYRRFDTAKSYSAVLEAGGPIIRDRLFVYGLVEFRNSESATISRTARSVFENKNNDPFYGFKVDAYPIDNHHFEFTAFDTRNTTRQTVRTYDETGGVPNIGLGTTVQDFNGGGFNFVGKYTGNFTDWLTLSAAYGRMRDRFDNVAVAGDAGLPAVYNFSGGTAFGVPFGGYANGQTTASTSFPYTTERKFWRGDADVSFRAFGDHHIRFGLDNEDNTLTEQAVRTGHSFVCDNGYLSPEACAAGFGTGGLYYILRAGNRVELNYFNSGGNFTANNRAYYAQDEWKVTDRLTLNLGVRRDDFKVNKADGTNFVTLDKNYAPRLGFTYDVLPEKTGKIFGSYGWYYLPFASNTAFRNTGNEYYLHQRFNYSGFDANGIPILGTQVTNRGDYQSTCPFPILPGGPTSYCSVTGDGSVPASDTIISQNLEATRESEWILGYEQKWKGWKFRLNYTHRNLDQTAEDVAIDKAVLAYCAANGIAGCSNTWTGFHQYVILNPGQDATVVLDGLDGRTVTLSAEDMQYPKAKRTYDAVTFSFQRPFDGHWSLNGSYTWSKSKGNSEGFVQSDFGQDDAGITQDFDQPGFTEYSSGYLPNDRRHRFKLWGAVALSQRVTVGANYTLESPRSLSCFGFYPDPNAFENQYGQASHYCGGQPSPRGTAQKSQWVSTLDMSGRYKFTVPSGQVVTLRADVFNLLNSQAVQKRNEIGDLDFSGTTPANMVILPNPNYGLPTLYQAPRSVRLGLDIEL